MSQYGGQRPGTLTQMSVYGSAFNESLDDTTSFRKSVMSKERRLGIAEAKRKQIRDAFQCGDEPDGSLDEMVIRGESIL